MFKSSRTALFIYGILCLGVIGSLLMPRLVVKYDGAAHIAVYALLTIWPVMMMGSFRKVLVVVLSIILISGVVEFLQRYSPERTASWMDFGMNTVGVAVGLAIGLLLKRKYQSAQA